jgi:hypothetical protein
MLKFKPYTDQELEALGNESLLLKGTYDFEVLSIEEKISRSMNEMLIVKIKVGIANDTRVIRDYLVFTDKMAWKFKHFCESIGLVKAYGLGCLDIQECVHGTGLCIIDVQEGAAKLDGSGTYPARNVVADYLKKDPLPGVVSEAFDDKDIPF